MCVHAALRFFCGINQATAELANRFPQAAATKSNNLVCYVFLVVWLYLTFFDGGYRAGELHAMLVSLGGAEVSGHARESRGRREARVKEGRRRRITGVNGPGVRESANDCKLGRYANEFVVVQTVGHVDGA